jgi:hypothetical protein
MLRHVTVFWAAVLIANPDERRIEKYSSNAERIPVNEDH